MSRPGLRFFLPFVISAVLLLLVVRSVSGEWNDLLAALASADWRLLVPAVGLYFCGAWLRSMRWGLLLPGQNLRTSMLFRALVIGFTVNNLLPLRMGEVARAYLLARWQSVPYGATVASLFVERVLDGLTLALLLLVAVLLVPSAPSYLLVAGAIAAGGFCAGAIVLGIAGWRADLILRLTIRLSNVLPGRLGQIAVRLADAFLSALAQVRGHARLGKAVILSLLAWCFELSVFFVLMAAFGVGGSPPLAYLVGSAANFATLVPSSPGYVGTFDGALIGVLRDTTGLAAGPATAYALVVHATLFLPVVIVGTLLLWRSHMSFDQITHAPERAAAARSSSDWQPAA
ncbi:MAG: flippase-like domain-containing protein [Chloroflexi bacterium]|nr:flippase-like domain-containing protein [Chloroflexota bacterium]